MGAYAAVVPPVLPEPVQDVSSNSKHERTTKGAMVMRTTKVPSAVEYVLFPAERHFRRHLHEDDGRDAHRFERYDKEEENAGGGGEAKEKDGV